MTFWRCVHRWASFDKIEFHGPGAPIKNSYVRDLALAHISVSSKTQSDLHSFLGRTPRESTIVHNGLNYPFKPVLAQTARDTLEKVGLQVPQDGFLMHIGGNQWYKNRRGVLEIYLAYARMQVQPIPLWMIGQSPTSELIEFCATMQVGEIKFVTNLNSEEVQATYSLAQALIFPSLAEGFGWPIVEAMACGCLVLTTAEEPMLEVGGSAAFYLNAFVDSGSSQRWADDSAVVLSRLLAMPQAEKERIRMLGFRHAQRFSTSDVLDKYEATYLAALNGFAGVAKTKWAS